MMCYANVKLDNLPFLTSILGLRFGHLLEVGTFDMGLLGVAALVEGRLFAWKILATFNGFYGQPLSNVFFLVLSPLQHL